MKQLLFILLLSINTAGLFANEQIVSMLKNHYCKSFEVATEDLIVEILKMHDLQESWLNLDLKIVTNHSIPKCGTQHAWLTILDDGIIVKKLPITLSLSVYKDVWIADQQIKRNQPLSSGMLRRNRQEVHRNYGKYHFGDLDYSGKTQIARKMVKGMVLTNQMLSTRPDVKRGDRVNVNVESKNFSISMAGKARQNGSIGEEIFITLDKTGKRLMGIIESPKEVIVRN